MAHATLEVVGNVGVITLNTPDNYNALGPQMSADLLQAIYDAVDDDAVRALLITGAGKGFCSGAQMGEEIFASGGDIGEIMRTTITPLITRLRTSDKPVVTAINGPAAGAGVGLALAGDIVIAGASALFLLSFVRLGATLDGATSAIIQRAIGPIRARGMALLGEPLRAAEAEACGLVWKTVPDDALMEEALRIATKLADGPPIAMAMIKRQLEDCWAMPLADVLALEADNQVKAFVTADLREGAAAFVEKRPPRFEGH